MLGPQTVRRWGTQEIKGQNEQAHDAEDEKGSAHGACNV